MKAGAVLTITDSAPADPSGASSSGGCITSQLAVTGEKGGGLYIDGGTVEMRGGALSQCAASAQGGGVYVADGGRLIMTGGEIRACEVTNSSSNEVYGGGVYVADGGAMEMNAGALYACEAKGYHASGGGAYIEGGGTFTMNGGRIQLCKASGPDYIFGGGGVYVASDGGPSVYGGETLEYGFRMNDGEIIACEAISSTNTAYGGVLVGDPMSGGIFEMMGGRIADCKATGDSNAYGGVCLLDGSSTRFTMTAGSISGCTAACSGPYPYAYGGGVCACGGIFEMKGGSIADDCTSYVEKQWDHGGLCLEWGRMLAHGGTVSCTTMNKNYIEHTDPDPTHITTFIGSVINEGGIISGGTFSGSVENGISGGSPGRIFGGVFQGTVNNGGGGTITDGTFHGTVNNGESGRISGGTFSEKPIGSNVALISYDTKGGSEIPPQWCAGTVAYKPLDPTRDEYIFDGWYRDEAYQTAYTFDIWKPEEWVIGENFTLYAKWIYGTVSVTLVIWEGQTSGGTVGASVDKVNAAYGKPLPVPEPPLRTGFNFTGWYTDRECTTLYDFEKPVTEEFTLFAGWEKAVYTVTYDSNGGSAVEPQTSSDIAEPVDPVKSGATFLGWFTESGKHWNFTYNTVTRNITLYARWLEDSTDPNPPDPPTTTPVTGVSLSKTALTLAKGGSETLIATVAPDDAANKTVLWSSTDASVVTVSGGRVTAVKAGMALIVARTEDGNHIAVCTVTVPEDAAPTPPTPAVPAFPTGGYGVTTYPVHSPDKTEHGTVTVSHRCAAHGETVSITVKPDDGFRLRTLTVTDGSGNKLLLTDQGSGKYAFTMPAGKVELEVSFTAASASSPFADVSADAYYSKAVAWAVENGITGGIGGGLFGPELPCTRAQIVTFLWRAAGSPEPQSMNSFTDVSAGSYYARAAAWTAENGIAAGTGSGKFSPDAVCTRAQIVTFLRRAY